MESMTFSEFESKYALSKSEILTDLFRQNKPVIKIKKENFAVKNLDLIFTTTLKLSNRSGFQTMTLRKLSEESGVSLGAIYSYIQNKEMLARMIIKYVLHSINRLFEESQSEHATAKDELLWIIRAHIYLTEQMQPWFYFSYMEARHFEVDSRKEAKESELYTESMVRDCLLRGIKTGEFKQVDPIMTSSLIKPLLAEWYLKSWKYRSRKTNVESYVDIVSDIVCSYILPTQIPDKK